MRTLLLLRHASATSPAGVADVDRPLSDAGVREAEALGRALAGTVGEGIDLVLCSPARRARDTAASLGVPAPLRMEPELYLAGEDDLLERIRQVEEQVHGEVLTLLVVAHNPGLQALARTLLANEADREAVAAGFPPATLAALRAPTGRWPDLRAQSCALSSLRIS